MQQDGNDCTSKLRARTLVRSQGSQYEECTGGGEGGRQWGSLVARAALEEGSPDYVQEHPQMDAGTL